eukprot:TRINITY_DN30513_c0_g1_i1.p1 TRINITY_DN30513_c0_g1~~TRINITY_DN30513_c0_g1_i1.p1  ORF type:complete len:299 (+),score=28.35 TRINITY_DN30513_c0_g1_i1:64-960(+)
MDGARYEPRYIPEGGSIRPHDDAPPLLPATASPQRLGRFDPRYVPEEMAAAVGGRGMKGLVHRSAASPQATTPGPGASPQRYARYEPRFIPEQTAIKPHDVPRATVHDEGPPPSASPQRTARFEPRYVPEVDSGASVVSSVAPTLHSVQWPDATRYDPSASPQRLGRFEPRHVPDSIHAPVEADASAAGGPAASTSSVASTARSLLWPEGTLRPRASASPQRLSRYEPRHVPDAAALSALPALPSGQEPRYVPADSPIRPNAYTAYEGAASPCHGNSAGASPQRLGRYEPRYVPDPMA